MYALYKELHPPTAVDHCVSCKFLNSKDLNIVTASGHVLRVYKVKKAKSSADSLESWKLEQVFETLLFDSPASLGVTRLAKSDKDALLIGFKEAKLSVVEFDQETHDIHTIALHYFEDEDSKLGTCNALVDPMIAVDPECRCAVMLVYRTKLAVLPYQKDELTTDKKSSTSYSSVFPSYIIDLTTVSDQIAQVNDVQFLHGYNKPTVCVLYETVPTWAGRIATFKDNLGFMALTLDTSRKLHAVVWTQKGLPYDSFALTPVPKPLGGVVVFAVNSLTYFSQSYPHYGVSLNSLAEKSSTFAFRSQCPHVLTLDGSKACFLTSDRLMLVMRNGQIYVVSLLTESSGMDLVRNISFELTTAAVQPSSVCRLGEEFVFLGSRCGNSLLLECSRTVEAIEPKAKKKKVVDMLEQDLFGDIQSSSQTMSFHFKVCDSVLNIGPISSMTIGEPEELSEEFVGAHQNTNMEVVACSGHGRSGALSVLQRSVKPHVVTTFELPGHRDMFTLFEAPKQDGSLSGVHSYLLLSGDSGTMVLQTGEEIAELGQSGFITDTATIGVGNVGDYRYNVQITVKSVVLLDGASRVHQMSMDSNETIVSSSICDPYIVVLLSNGTLQLLTLEGGNTPAESVEGSEEHTAKITSTFPSLNEDLKITFMCTFTDKSGLFTTLPQTAVDDRSVEVKREPLLSSDDDRPRTDSYSRLASALDDEDEMLYGTSTEPTTTTTEVKMDSSDHVDLNEAFEPSREQKTGEMYWCAVTYENGALEMFSLPEFVPVFYVRMFSNGGKVLRDSPPTSSPIKVVTPTGNVRDLLLTGMGPKQEYPTLISIVDEDVLVYRAVAAPRANVSGRLQVIFVKVCHDVVVREKKSAKPKPVSDSVQGNADKAGTPPTHTRLLRPFGDIAGYTGVFVCGSYPHWMIMGKQGWLFTHPMYIDGPVNTFAMFNNQNCPKGFLYFNQEGELRICVLPKAIQHDQYWPVRKVPLKATPHFVAYHPEAKVHAVITGETFPVKQMPVIANDDVESMKPEERDSRFPFPTDEKFQLRLYAPGSWEPVPKCNVKFDDFEHVTCMKVGSLRSSETVSGRKNFIMVGTCDVRTEEVSSKGKVYLLDVVRENPSSDEPGKKATLELQLAGCKEVKSPVTCLEAVDGHLLGCVCQKIYIWQFKNKELTPVAFIDTDVYIHSVSVLKNFILIADIMKNVKLLRFKNDLKSLSLISRDPYSSNVYSIGFIVDGDQLGFVATDAQCNISVYQYQPEIPECFGGRVLHRQCDFRCSDVINCLLRVRCKPSVSVANEKEPKWAALEKRHATYFATVDGGIGLILPVPERMFRRLNMLQTKMMQGFSHGAGVNPKASRYICFERIVILNVCSLYFVQSCGCVYSVVFGYGPRICLNRYVCRQY
jgi:cleavage and polyadenylation specificity factor subunit 1